MLTCFLLAPSLVHSKRNANALSRAPFGLTRFRVKKIGLGWLGILRLDGIHLIIVPALLEVGNPCRCQLTLFEKIVTSLKFGIYALACTDTAGCFARN